MKILTISAMIALPFMALGQATEPQQQQQQQEQTKQGQATETQPAPPAKGKKETPAPEPVKTKAKPETANKMHEQADAKQNEGRAQDVNKNQQPGAHSSTSQTNGKAHVNVQEFKARHREVFSLGRHPKEFFVQRFGPTHFRLIGETYFVWVDSCWVAVEVEGFGYSERVICADDPEYIVVD
jgi:cytoskeletal protein RodZ